MLLPGPEAQQLATYIGWLLHRTIGGLVAGSLFVLPGFLSILVLSILYARFHDLTLVQGVFYGLKPAVVAIVFEAVIRIGRRSLKNSTMVVLAAAAFVAIFYFQVPFPLIVLAAGVIGFVGGKMRPKTFVVIKGHAASDENAAAHVVSDEYGSAVSTDQAHGARPHVLAPDLVHTDCGLLDTDGLRERVYARIALFQQSGRGDVRRSIFRLGLHRSGMRQHISRGTTGRDA
jgi:chromate transport protein ChrA